MISQIKSKFIKEEIVDNLWAEAMKEELSQFEINEYAHSYRLLKVGLLFTPHGSSEIKYTKIVK